MSSLLNGIGALMALASGVFGAQAQTAEGPIRLVAETVNAGVTMQVIGSSNDTVEAKYELEVVGDLGGGSNRSVQRGEVRLLPGIPVTLINLTLGNVASGSWQAHLRVEPHGGTAYQETLSADPWGK